MMEHMKTQRFGVEIEMTGISRGRAAELVAEVLSSTVSGPNSTCYHTRQIVDHRGRTWQVMRDSSINPQPRYDDELRVEFVTPPLDYDDVELLQNIVRKLRENGAIANKSCGIHIHVDGANHTPASIRRLLNFFTARQDLIYEALSIGERAFHWCHKISPALNNEVQHRKDISYDTLEGLWYSPYNDDYCGGISREHYNSTRYHGINLHAFFTKGTIEFRLFNGTLHAGRIKAYIQFCLAMSAWAIDSSDKMSFRSTEGYTAAQKAQIMESVLTNRLGLRGDEFKTCRYFLLKNFKDEAGIPYRHNVA